MGWTQAARLADAGPVKLGVRPEYLRRVEPGAPGGLPVRVERLQDVGTYLLLTADFEGNAVRARLNSAGARRRDGLAVGAQHTCFYRDEELIR